MFWAFVTDIVHNYRTVLIKSYCFWQGWLSLAHSFSVISTNVAMNAHCQNLDSLNCIFVADSVGLALNNSTQLALKSNTFSVNITQRNGHYAVQGHSRSPILIPVESPCDLLASILTYILSHAVSKLLQIFSQIFAFNMEFPLFNL